MFDVRVHVARDPVRGKIRQVTRTTRNGIRAARTLRANLLADVAKGKYGGTNATVETLLDDWIVLAKRKGRSPATVAGYQSKRAKGSPSEPAA